MVKLSKMSAFVQVKHRRVVSKCNKRMVTSMRNAQFCQIQSTVPETHRLIAYIYATDFDIQEIMLIDANFV